MLVRKTAFLQAETHEQVPNVNMTTSRSFLLSIFANNNHWQALFLVRALCCQLVANNDAHVLGLCSYLN